jgi:cytochrome c-type biogenesis protein
MDSFYLALTTSFWLGILTSISPCPLATNIAAVSYIGQKTEHKSHVVVSGLLYALGRVITYVIIAFMIVASLLAIPSLSIFLQTQMTQLLGPLLIITGMFLLEWLSLKFAGINIDAKFQQRVGRHGIIAALPLGIIFALSFCPVSAAIFFGSLIPLAINQDSSILLPFIYGIGTAIPVIAFSLILTFASHFIAKVFNKITVIESWMRKITGIIFIIVGVYMALVYIFELQL